MGRLKFLLFLGMTLWSLTGRAAHVRFIFENATADSATNRNFTLFPVTMPSLHGSAIVGRKPVFTNTAAGTIIVSNLAVGRYQCLEDSEHTPTPFFIDVPDTNAVVDASTIIVITPAPSSTYARDTADARFIRRSNDWGISLTLTNPIIPAGAQANYVWSSTGTDGTGSWQPPGIGSGESNVLGNSGTTNSSGHLSLVGNKIAVTLNVLTLGAGSGLIITNEAGTNLQFAVTFNTNGLATIVYAQSLTNGFVQANVTNGLATISYVNTATNGLVQGNVTNGLATIAYVNGGTITALTVTNGATLLSTLRVDGSATFASSVNADSVTVTNVFTAKSTSSHAGASTFASSVSADNITSTNTVTAKGQLNTAGAATFASSVNADSVTVTNLAKFLSGLNLTGALNVGGITTLSNALTVKGGVSNETWQTTAGIATNLSDAYFKNVPPFSFLTVDGNGKLAPINGNSNGIVGNINNGFPQIRSKISTNGVLYPIWFGDSLVTGQLAAPQEENFVNSYGLAGFQGQQGAGYGPISWTATNVSATYTQDDFTSFFTTYYIVTNGGSVVWFTTNSAVAASANGVNANVITLDYIEESGAGTFKIQTNAAPAGAFADFQTGINANNGGAKHGVPLRYTNAFAANMMVKVVVTAGNPVKIIAPGLFNSTNGGTVLNIFAHGGLGIDQFVQCPTNVTGPIVAAWNPDLIVTKWLDSSTLMQASFASFNAFCSNYIPRCDILWVGANPIIAGTAANISDVKIANMAQFSNALFTAQSYFDGYSIFGTTNNAVARGYLSSLLGNDPHPTVAGDTFTARLIAQWMDLFVHDTTAEGALTYTYPSTVPNSNLTNAWLKTKTAGGVKGISISQSKIQSDAGIYMSSPVVINGDPNVFNPTDPLTVSGNVNIFYPGNLWLQGGAAGAGNFLLSWGVFSNAWNAAGDVAMNWKQPAGAYTNVAELKNSSSQTTFSIGSNGIVQYQVPGSATIYPAHYTVFTQTADGTACTNISTASTSILGTGVGSLTLPAGFWQVGRQLILDVEGDYWTGASPGNTYITAKLGSTVMCSNLFAITASMTQRAFYGKVTMTCRTNSAIGAISTSGELHFPSGAAFVVQQMTNIVTILDTTGAMAVDMPATNGATTTSIRSHNANLTLR